MATNTPTPRFCPKCGSELVLTTVPSFTFDTHTGKRSTSRSMLLVCMATGSGSTLNDVINSAHVALTEADLEDSGYEVPNEMALFYDRRFDRRTDAALARRRAAGDAV